VSPALHVLLEDAIDDRRLSAWHRRRRCITLRAPDGTTRDLSERDTRDFLSSGLPLSAYLLAVN
jgi:hypothetical protein